MNKTFDVIVVGGGPAGSTAAYVLAERGFDVLIVDRATFPRPKTCGGLLTEKVTRLNERVFGLNPSSFVGRNVMEPAGGQYSVYFDSSLLVSGESEYSFYLTRREQYDYELLKRARKAGVLVHDGDGVTSITERPTEIVTRSGQTFQGRYLVGADGANSTVRRAVTRRESENRVQEALGVETFIPRREWSPPHSHLTIHLGLLTEGYGWVFPRSECSVVGVGGSLKGRVNHRHLLDEFLTRLGVNRNGHPIKGHPVPVFTPPGEAGTGNILLAGDAAGLVDPITGEGIYYAQRSGELAARSILDSMETTETALDMYNDKLCEHILPGLRAALRLRPLFYGKFFGIRKGWLKLFFSLFHRSLVKQFHGVHSYGSFAVEHPEIQGASPGAS